MQEADVTNDFATEMDTMLRAMKRGAEYATSLAKECVGGGVERFRTARLFASAARASYIAAVDIRDGYCGLEPGDRYLKIQSLCDTVGGCIEGLQALRTEHQHATDAGVN